MNTNERAIHQMLQQMEDSIDEITTSTPAVKARADLFNMMVSILKEDDFLKGVYRVEPLAAAVMAVEVQLPRGTSDELVRQVARVLAKGAVKGTSLYLRSIALPLTSQLVDSALAAALKNAKISV